MKLLAMDIGGTRCRIAHCHIDSKNKYEIIDTFEFATEHAAINGFSDLLKHYSASCPNSFLKINDYDAIAIAIAGPVVGTCTWPPNISWSLDLQHFPELPAVYMLNDFAAQAYALISGVSDDRLIPVRVKTTHNGVSAVIGAGTGLGHCLLVPEQDSYRVIASEAGQASFTFNREEQAIETFILDKLNSHYATNDHVVSGPGIELIHEFLTGKQLNAAEICSDKTRHQQTLSLFSRFYGRACRNFCLTGCVSDRLIISGGIAAKHPELIASDAFLSEFEDSVSHMELLDRISISINPNEQLGIYGIIQYSLKQLFPN